MFKVNSALYQWISGHAASHRFLPRYPADKELLTGIGAESWHYRYVGFPHASLMAVRGRCLEASIGLPRQYPYDGPHLFTAFGGQTYEIYFCSMDNLYVPVAAHYTLSGNNMDGYIVTVLP